MMVGIHYISNWEQVVIIRKELESNVRGDSQIIDRGLSIKLDMSDSNSAVE